MTVVLTTVTRWAPLIIESARNAGLPEQLIGPYTAEMMAMMARESRGNPDAQNKAGRGKYGALGLWQFNTRYYKDITPSSTAKKHAQKSADVVVKTLLPNTGGHIPSAVAAFAAGSGAMSDWINGDDSGYFAAKSVGNVVRAHKAGGPVDSYASWYGSWAAAGFPTIKETIERADGRRETYTMAADIGPPRVKPFSTGWAGKLCWRNKCRLAQPAGARDYIQRIPAPPGNEGLNQVAVFARQNPVGTAFGLFLVSAAAAFGAKAAGLF